MIGFSLPAGCSSQVGRVVRNAPEPLGDKRCHLGSPSGTDLFLKATRNRCDSWLGCLRRGLAFATFLVAATGLSAEPIPLKIVGNQLLDSGDRAVRLRGVNCAGLEWSSDGGGSMLSTMAVAVSEWRANLIRLPLSQDRWFGKAPEQHDGGASYRALVRQVVDFCAVHNAYVILDLHWSDAGVWGRNIGQHNLPDQNSVVFWKDFAAVYRNHPAVLFDLYNEPANINWDQWFRGGAQTETDEKTRVALTYKAVGLPALVAAIRSTGARNVIVAGGINWAYEVGGIADGRELVDPMGDGVVYAVHPYPHEYAGIGRETIAQWTARMEAFARRFPIIVTEFGSLSSSWPFPKEWNCTDEKWNREMIGVLEDHRWNWTAWDFHPTAAPCLITGWSYVPTPEFGVWVKQALQKNAGR
jgi:endoglucanase